VQPPSNPNPSWPDLPLKAWSDTYQTLHLWTQIVGKIRLKRMPWINHSWHVTLYVTARGLTTGAMPHGDRTFEIAFDFVDHELRIETGDGAVGGLALEPRPVAEFYASLLAELSEMGLPVEIYPRPNEIENPIPFADDRVHAAYDPEFAHRLWRALAQTNRVFHDFRARFLGKTSPVHFFWGSFDLAVTRFSGRRAPLHPGGIPFLPDWVAQEAYSHEVSSCGFWPGGGALPYPLFYAYAYPAPPGFAEATVRPAAAFFSPDFGEFVLPYDEVRRAARPDELLMEFLHSTYEAAADLAGWDRAALERKAPPGPPPRGT
jgi:Family of unknown function (DUF5996)